MKNRFLCLLVLSLLSVISCKKDTPTPSSLNIVTSQEFEDDLLFVNRNDFKILTDKPAEFSSSSPLIQLSADGTIKRITSGEVVPIDITWTDASAGKTRIYALGATDDNHDKPYSSYHGKLASNPYESYRQGWQTIRKSPAGDKTYALILRHADADDGRDYSAANPGSNGPANWWKSCENTLARQLNARGNARSEELGKIFKDLNYPISRVISSEFCRSVSTARLINAGAVIKEDGRINHPAYNTSKMSLFKGMLEIMAEQPVDNKMTLMVTHHPVNETGSAGYPSFPETSPFTWTGGYMISVASDKTITYQGAVSYSMFEYWRNLKLKRL